MKLLPLTQYRDFKNEDGTYDEGVTDIVNAYNEIVRKHNSKVNKINERLFCKELQESLGNYFYKSDIDDSKAIMKDWIGTMSSFGCICYDTKGNISQFATKDVTVKQITLGIQHVTTPSKNYFLFKLSK